MYLNQFIDKLSQPDNVRMLQCELSDIRHLVSNGNIRKALDRLFGGLKINLKTGSELNESLLSNVSVTAVTQFPFYIDKSDHYYFCHLLEAFVTSTAYHSNSNNLQLLNYYSNKQKQQIKNSNQRLENLYKKYHCKYIISEVIPGYQIKSNINLYTNLVKYHLVSKSDVFYMLKAINNLINFVYQNNYYSF